VKLFIAGCLFGGFAAIMFTAIWLDQLDWKDEDFWE